MAWCIYVSLGLNEVRKQFLIKKYHHKQVSISSDYGFAFNGPGKVKMVVGIVDFAKIICLILCGLF